MRFTIFIFFVFTVSLISAQTGINYQATINDNNGNLVRNTSVSLRFTISNQLQPNLTSNDVYVETHQVAIDDSGVFNILIGVGNTISQKVFSDIDWSEYPIYLQREVDFGQGYIVTGTTPFSSVPIAEYAKNTAGTTSSTFKDAQNNIVIGSLIPSATASATYNTLLGHNAGNSITSGRDNLYMGNHTGHGTTSGFENIAIGNNSFQNNTIGERNTAVGGGTLSSNTTAERNVAVGSQAGNNVTTGSRNVIVGSDAGGNLVDSNRNTLIGFSSNVGTTSGIDNSTAVGAFATVTTSNTIQLGNGDITLVNTSGTVSASAFSGDGSQLTNVSAGTTSSTFKDAQNNIVIGSLIPSATASATYNTLLGHNAGNSITSGRDNLYMGNHTGHGTTSGFENIAIGNNSFQNNTIGERNTAVGGGTLSSNTTAERNVAVGSQAGNNVTTGSRNVIVGSDAGGNLVDSNRNTLIGFSSNVGTTSGIDNSTAVGAFATVTTSNTIQLGNGDITLVNTSGTVSASAFSGDGSQLTNVSAGTSSSTFKDAQNNIVIGSLIPSATASATYNTLLGHNAGNSITSGRDNLYMGNHTGHGTTSGTGNIAIGNNSFQNNTIGELNTAVGGGTLSSNTTAERNVAVGSQAGNNVTTGSRNVIVGSDAGGNLVDSNRNTLIGFSSNVGTTSGIDNSTAVGAFATVTTSNTIQLGNGDITLVNTSGTVSASAFSGDGSQLTNVSAGTSSSTFKDAQNNIVIGSLIPSATASATYNTLLGHNAGNSITSGRDNLYMGNHTGHGTTSGTGNIAIGNNSFQNNTIGELNTAVGGGTLSSNTTAERNVAVGSQAGNNVTTGSRNVIVGSDAGGNLVDSNRNTLIGFSSNVGTTSGIDNSTAVGAFATVTTSNTIQLGNGDITLVNTSGTVSASAFSGDGSQLTNVSAGTTSSTFKDAQNNIVIGSLIPSATASATYNTLLGHNAGNSITSGRDNLYMGNHTGHGTTSGFENIAIGNNSFQNNTIGERNTAVGGGTLSSNTTAERNVAVGSQAGNNVTTGSRNVIVGSDAGGNLVDSNRNTLIGFSSNVGTTSGIDNSTAVGAFATVTTSNTIQLGNGDITLVNTSGTVSASAFSGDGSQLTNVSAGTTSSTFKDAQNNIVIGSLIPSATASATYNTLLGHNAGNSITSGRDNLYMGNHTGHGTTSGTGNIAIGNNSFQNNTIGELNTAVGGGTLSSNTTAERNVAVGSQAGNNVTTGSRNVIVGSDAGGNLVDSNRNTLIGFSSNVGTTSGIDNSTAVGAFATVTTSNTIQLGNGDITLVNTSGTVSASAFSGDGSQLTNVSAGTTSSTFKDAQNNIVIGSLIPSATASATYNTLLGHNAGNSITSGRDNLYMGNHTGYGTTSGTGNIAIGNNSFQNNTIGELNTAVGGGTLSSNTTAERNVAVGSQAGNNVTTGSRNVIVGSDAGGNLVDSNRNTLIGFSSNVGTTSGIDNSTAVGAFATVTTSNTIVFGNSSVDRWSFGRSSNDDGKALQVGSNTSNGNGAYLTDGGVWTNASSIAFKTNFTNLVNSDILSKIKMINVLKWKYKGTEEYHIGPFAEEFKELFSLGVVGDNEHISTMDIAGVALKGVQALEEELEKQKSINNDLVRKNKLLEQKLNDISAKLEILLKR